MRTLPTLAVLVALAGLSRAEEPRPRTIEEALVVLRAAESYDGEHVGLVGATTPSWHAYEVLREKADAARLTALVEDPKPVVRCYAFRALAEKHPGVDVYEVLGRRLGDAEAVLGFPGGCCGFSQAVADWLFEAARPRLTAEQIRALDVRLIEEDIPLIERRRALEHETFDAVFLPKLRALLSKGVHPALVALARAGQKEDLDRVETTLRSANGDALVAALQAVVVRPDARFFPVLEKRTEEALKGGEFPVRPYAAAIVAYRDRSAVDFLFRLLGRGFPPDVVAWGLQDRPEPIFDSLRAAVRSRDD